MHKQKANPYFSTSKVQYYIFRASLFKIKLYKCFPIQIENINLITNLSYCWFYGMLIACRCITFYKKLYCDVKKWTTLLCNHPWISYLGLLKLAINSHCVHQTWHDAKSWCCRFSWLNTTTIWIYLCKHLIMPIGNICLCPIATTYLHYRSFIIIWNESI
jgi:hypothetical protein